MLRVSIKYGISEALSSVPGYEVWDFEIKQRDEAEGISLEIRYRYMPDLHMRIALTGDEGAISVDLESNDIELAVPSIAIEAVPGALNGREAHTVASLDDLYECIAAWAGRLDVELAASVRTRVLSAQQKAISRLGESLKGIPDRPISQPRVQSYRTRLERVEAVVVELRGKDDAARIEEIHEDFESLRARAAVLNERDFLYSVLVRLVKHLWDEESLSVVDGVGRATRALFDAPAPGLAGVRYEALESRMRSTTTDAGEVSV